ncbi:DUF4083 domain-containing protein [Sediminibacillus dalangtanensis]|uniref:DUF4083 domain-containing protein n=1 Tax=Sediminibacillus dalangtanensis TaxID=2729421 RepID=A0ABX7VUD0_9BACI|nr:DUF4083 domain-containing protein [Sediminibacillus dalangtanensis]QTN00578.1 DUF4083 domain-containing protein [Sediminibacillus dalangtanensis]
MGNLLWGDVLVQFVYLLILVLIVMLFVSVFRSQAKRQRQLDRIEKKIDQLNGRERSDDQRR